jgi:membrane dipeptidase
MTLIVDSHEDIAWNALTFGRDYTLPVAATRLREAGTEIPTHNGQTLLGWAEWLLGRVAMVFATLQAAPIRRQTGAWDSQCYADSEQAHRLYWNQLEFYHRLVDDHPDKFRLVLSRGDLEATLAGWEGDDLAGRRVGLVLLMEGADAVRGPEELPEWYEGGMRILGPAWMGTRYAGGTREPGPLTADGHALLEVMADLGVILDLSHMAEPGMLEAFDRYPGSIIASHANSLALLPGYPYPERQLSDLAIQRLAEHEGVVGIVPYNRFLRAGWERPDGRTGLTLDHVVAHIDHVCQLVGDAAHVGIGSDFDGGFGLDAVPEGLDSVADLRFIGDRLGAHGFSRAEVDAVLGGNWLRLLRRALPET